MRESSSIEGLDLSGASSPTVLTIPTAKHTKERFDGHVEASKKHFAKLGVEVLNLHEFDIPPSQQEIDDKVGRADMIWVTGGDTLKAMDFWDETGITDAVIKAASWGTVMSGGSAGMLAWMQTGHSDWESFRAAGPEDEWDYRPIRGLGLIAATGCPHYETATEGGEMREASFKRMLMNDNSLPTPAIGITNSAALALFDGYYRVFEAPYKDDPPVEVHVLGRTEDGLSDRLLPVSSGYQPIDF